MPDFDTRKPRGHNEPNRVRIQVVANKLRTVLIATRPRLRTLLVGGGVFLFVIVAVPAGLLMYSSGGPTTGGDQPQVVNEVTCGTDYLHKTGECHPPSPGEEVEICEPEVPGAGDGYFGPVDTGTCR